MSVQLVLATPIKDEEVPRMSIDSDRRYHHRGISSMKPMFEECSSRLDSKFHLGSRSDCLLDLDIKEEEAFEDEG